jgi:hypothetical protein
VDSPTVGFPLPIDSLELAVRLGRRVADVPVGRSSAIKSHWPQAALRKSIGT